MFFVFVYLHRVAYILKAKKFAEPSFQSKKIAEKVRKSGRHFCAIWGNFGPFWVIFGPFKGHVGPFCAIWGHIWATLGHFDSFLGHFVAFLDKFAESSNFLRDSWGPNPRF